MKKILYVTTSRADYWIIKKLLLQLDKKVELDILISGMHILHEYGDTFKEVVKDFPNSKFLELKFIKTNDKYSILDTMSEIQLKFTNFLRHNSYDAIILLGDRSEILPFAICSSILGIPIIHLHGGEVTYGAYDEFIRHCITKMASLHLTSTEVYKNRVIQMGENNVYNIGSLGSMNAHSFSFNKNIVPDCKYIVVLYHPETVKNNLSDIHELIEACKEIKKYGINFVFIGCNNDVGGDHYNKFIKEECKNNNFIFYQSLNSDDWFSLVSKSICLVGNSSSGIIEIPCLCKNIINVGDRQKGREKSKFIIDVECKKDRLITTIENVLKTNEPNHENPYCNQNSIYDAEKIILGFLKLKPKTKEFIDLKIKQ